MAGAEKHSCVLAQQNAICSEAGIGDHEILFRFGL